MMPLRNTWKNATKYALVLLTLFLVGLARAAEPASIGGQDVLTRNTFWRWHMFLRKPMIPLDQLKAAGIAADGAIPLKGRELIAPYASVDRTDTPPPAADWEKPEFDDSTWPKADINGIQGQAFRRFSVTSVRLRGRFLVDNPAAVKEVSLSMKCYGGAVVYLNGKEVTRAHLAKGRLDDETLAEAYPMDVQVDEEKVPIPSARFRRNLPADIKGKLAAIVEKRWRALGPLKIPSSALKKGMNVLAIELRRSPYPGVAKEWFAGKAGKGMPSWIPLDLAEISLKIDGDGVHSGLGKPSGLRVWNEDRNVRISLADYPDPTEPLRPIVIFGAKNGTFCGQVIVGSDAPIKGLKVSAGVLTSVAGSATIPSEKVRILYGKADTSFYGMHPWFDALLASPPTEINVEKRYGRAVMPIYVGVTIPKDRRAGRYEGTITISTEGAPAVAVPIRVNVADWTVPDPSDYRTYVGIYQSPTTVSMQYNVKMWSEEHWKLLEKSFALLARAGNKMVNIPVVDQTQFGNEEGFIYWIKKPDGSFEHDFTIFDRYLRLAVKHCGPLDYVPLQIWHAGGWSHRGADQKNTVTVLDRATGTHTPMQVPRFDSPEARVFWKPVFSSVQARLSGMGMTNAMAVGILSDSTAPPEVFTMFDEVMPPKAKWHRGCHTQNRSPTPYPANKGGGIVVLHEHCYGLNMADPDQPLPAFWSLRGKPATAYDRISNHERYMSLSWYRNTAALSILRLTQGIGRVCLDFWPVMGTKGKEVWIYNRYPDSSCAQREPSMQKMTWPGPDGAMTTLRYETFLEGIQDAEALIYISEAISKKSELLGPELTKECSNTIVDLMRYQCFGSDRAPMRPYFYGWQEVSANLYACAAKVAKATGAK